MDRNKKLWLRVYVYQNTVNMPVYHFIFVSSRGKQTTLLIQAETYTEALPRAEKFIQKLPGYSGVVDDYNLVLEWIERGPFKSKPYEAKY